MLRLYFSVTLSTTILFHLVTLVGGGCSPLPPGHFQWLNPDNSLLVPQAPYDGRVFSGGEDECDSCGPKSTVKWVRLPESPSCQFCSTNATLVCEGPDLYKVPSPVTLPSTRLSLFKISGVGLISLPPKSFMGLYIQKLVIENSNLSYLATETFSGVKSITSLYLKNNMLDYIPQADCLFENIKDLKFLSLEDNGLRVLTSAVSANLHNLTYFSLAGNVLYTMNVAFLQNSGLTFLDLRNITFKIRHEDIEGTDLSKLPNSLNTIDLSRSMITTGAIDKVMEQLKGKPITTLNLSYLRSPFKSFWALRHVKNFVQYLSLKGTDLHPIFRYSKRAESLSLKSVQFVNMRELNLEDCNITYIQSGDIFKAFPNLTTFSLARNKLFVLDLSFFNYLPKLWFIDLSNNLISDILFKVELWDNSIKGVDLSNTKLYLDANESAILFDTLKNVESLSLCQTEMSVDTTFALRKLNNLKYLDLTATLLSSYLEPTIVNYLFNQNNGTLTELHFGQNNFKIPTDYPSFFSQLVFLETLDISNNSIQELSNGMFSPTVKTLNATQNLIITWYFSILKNNSQLQILDMSNNQITYISDAMIEDFYQLESLSLDSNPLICHNKVVALVCSKIKERIQNFNDTQDIGKHNKSNRYNTEITTNNSQTLTLVDWQQYRCYDLLLNGFRQFSEEKDCNEYYEEVSTTRITENPTTQYDDQETTTIIQPVAKTLGWSWKLTYFIVGPIILVSALGSIIYLKWWNIRCFIHRYISMKKARLLRKNGNLLAKPEVYYDVFVSYSDVDRGWVLDHLLPNMERDSDVSLCFHERDFQVGMTILENIIDCMDRSHALLLVVSSSFLYSKWCQFEMHLAQYRLVETFRDHLVLVLLEDIPRKARPQTLHHLMMTKTYLMWPQQPCKDEAYDLFWRRLKRALRPNPNYTLPV